MAIRDHLLDIQYGRAADTHNWLHRSADAELTAIAGKLRTDRHQPGSASRTRPWPTGPRTQAPPSWPSSRPGMTSTDHKPTARPAVATRRMSVRDGRVATKGQHKLSDGQCDQADRTGGGGGVAADGHPIAPPASTTPAARRRCGSVAIGADPAGRTAQVAQCGGSSHRTHRPRAEVAEAASVSVPAIKGAQPSWQLTKWHSGRSSIPNCSRTPARMWPAKAITSAVLAPPRLDTASACLVDKDTRPLPKSLP